MAITSFRKLIPLDLVLLVMLGGPLFIGCFSEESKVEDIHRVKTPQGTTTVTATKKVESDHRQHEGTRQPTSACTCPKEPNGLCPCDARPTGCQCTDGLSTNPLVDQSQRKPSR